MKKQILLIALLVLLSTGCTNQDNKIEVANETQSTESNESTDKKIVFKDPKFEEAVRGIIKKETGDIYKSDVESITYFRAENAGIKGLEDIHHFKNINALVLKNNEIDDIEAIAELTELTAIALSGNNISDISPLANLTKIEVLALSENNISDISALSKLAKITSLYLGDNEIKDISSLSNLYRMGVLHLNDNKITDLSALSDSVNLMNLELQNNEIEDIESLSSVERLTILKLNNNKITDVKELAGLKRLSTLLLAGNPITDFTPISSYYDSLKTVDIPVSAFEEKIVSTVSNNASNDDSETTTIVNEKEETKKNTTKEFKAVSEEVAKKRINEIAEAIREAGVPWEREFGKYSHVALGAVTCSAFGKTRDDMWQIEIYYYDLSKPVNTDDEDAIELYEALKNIHGKGEVHYYMNHEVYHYNGYAVFNLNRFYDGDLAAAEKAIEEIVLGFDD